MDEIQEFDRVEWKTPSKGICKGLVVGTQEGCAAIAVDAPPGEMCPIVWGPLTKLSKIDDEKPSKPNARS